MFEIRKTKIEELAKISEMGSQEHLKSFLSTKSMREHQIEFADKNTIYLSIINTSDIILGYFILLKNKDKYSIQLKRIVISEDHLGLGQNALIELETYCIDKLKIKHITLDVYDNNYKAIHIYEKIGYQLISSKINHNRKVLFYDKFL